MLFCCKISFFEIYAVLLQNLFLSRFTHFLWGENFSQKSCPWKKMTNIMYGPKIFSDEILKQKLCWMELWKIHDADGSFDKIQQCLINWYWPWYSLLAQSSQRMVLVVWYSPPANVGGEFVQKNLPPSEMDFQKMLDMFYLVLDHPIHSIRSYACTKLGQTSQCKFWLQEKLLWAGKKTLWTCRNWTSVGILLHH